jgi:hypothetical protein
MNAFRHYADYEIPLLQVLSDLPGGQGTAQEVRDRFGERFDDRIPVEHRVYLENIRDTKWRNIVAWVRSGLSDRGLVDGPKHGIWRITDMGREHLAQVGNPPPIASPQPASASPAQSRRGTTTSNDGSARAHLGTSIEPTRRAHAIVDAQIAAVRDLLSGRASRPSDERLCDWVHFCYELELYREGQDLFALVDPMQLNSWYYERARRLAKVCAMKVSGKA